MPTQHAGACDPSREFERQQVGHNLLRVLFAGVRYFIRAAFVSVWALRAACDQQPQGKRIDELSKQVRVPFGKSLR